MGRTGRTGRDSAHTHSHARYQGKPNNGGPVCAPAAPPQFVNRLAPGHITARTVAIQWCLTRGNAQQDSQLSGRSRHGLIRQRP
jgi:hypothetical protein